MTNKLDNGMRKTLPKSLQIFLWVDLLLLALSSACEVFCRAVLHLGFPYDGPLLFEYFPDLVDLRPRFEHFHTLAFYTDATDPMCMYPAPIAAGYRVFYLFRPHDLAVFLLFSAACFGVAAIIFGYSLYRRGLSGKSAVLFSAVVLLTAYPAWFQLKQANMEILSWAALCVGMWLYFRNKGYSAAACLGLAGALKLLHFFTWAYSLRVNNIDTSRLHS